MLRRLYAHNFRCLENFEFKVDSITSALLIGKNGSGKSTLARVLKIFQGIGRGATRVGELVKPADFTLGRTDIPMRFEIEVSLGGRLFHYVLALELPERFRELRVLEERLEVDGEPIYSRQQAQVSLRLNTPHKGEANLDIDWIDRNVLALPLIQDPTAAGVLTQWRQWLAHMVILAPVPQLMTGESQGESLAPLENGGNFAEWLTGLLAQYPSAYNTIYEYLKQAMPDIGEFKNTPLGKDTKTLVVRFDSDNARFEPNFDDLSDGEKCLFLCAVVLASNKAYGPIFVFWDEPDNYLALSEVGHFIMALRRGFDKGGQILVTSHNEETIRCFGRKHFLPQPQEPFGADADSASERISRAAGYCASLDAGRSGGVSGQHLYASCIGAARGPG